MKIIYLYFFSFSYLQYNISHAALYISTKMDVKMQNNVKSSPLLPLCFLTIFFYAAAAVARSLAKNCDYWSIFTSAEYDLIVITCAHGKVSFSIISCFFSIFDSRHPLGVDCSRSYLMRFIFLCCSENEKYIHENW